jgi:hypothetical protein
MGKAHADLMGDAEGSLAWEGTAAESLAQGLTLDALHDEGVAGGVGMMLEQAQDVGRVEPGEDVDLSSEAGATVAYAVYTAPAWLYRLPDSAVSRMRRPVTADTPAWTTAAHSALSQMVRRRHAPGISHVVVTGIAIFQLVERGELELDAPVSKLVDHPCGNGVTAADLLAHTSGVPNDS